MRKYVARNLHQTITLKSGIPGNPVMAIPETPGIYAKFIDGQLFLDDNDPMIPLLESSKLFKNEFFLVNEANPDPYAGRSLGRQEEHVVMEMGAGGTPGKQVNPPPVPVDTSAIRNLAAEMIKEMLPAILEKERVKMRQEILDENTASINSKPKSDLTNKAGQSHKAESPKP